MAKILRGPLRERYDHFLKNGFPERRGSGYFYTRVRPGMGTVFFGLFLLSGVAHYIILVVNTRKQKEFMANIIKETRQAAFGPSGVSGLAAALGESSGDDATVAKKLAKKDKKKRTGETDVDNTPVRRKVSNGLKSFIVEGNGDVFLIDETEDGPVELLLDVNDIEPAKWGNTILAKWPRGIWNLTIGRFIPEKAPVEEVDDVEEVVDEAGVPVAPKKKGVPKKLERTGDGMPRKRKVARPAGKAAQ